MVFRRTSLCGLFCHRAILGEAGTAREPRFSPDCDLGFEFDAGVLAHPGADQFNEPEHVASGRAGVSNDEARIFIADLYSADSGAHQTRLRDESAGAQAARISKRAGGSLEAQRLVRLALDPCFTQALDDGVRSILLQLEFSTQY